MVGINPTRRGAELATDIRHTDCQLVVTERKLLGLLDGLDIGVPRDRVLVVDTDEYRERVRRASRRRRSPTSRSPADATVLLVFTSGTSGAPKAAIVSQRRLAMYGRTLSDEPGAHRGVGLLPRDADVPLQRAVRGLVARGLRGCDDRAAAALLGVAASSTTSAATARPTSTTSASRSATSSPRRRAPTTASTRSCASSATKAPSTTSRGSASASACPSSTATDRPRAA